MERTKEQKEAVSTLIDYCERRGRIADTWRLLYQSETKRKRVGKFIVFLMWFIIGIMVWIMMLIPFI